MGTQITKVKTRAKPTPALLNKQKAKVDAGALLADEYGMAEERVKREADPITKAFDKAKEKLKAFLSANYEVTSPAKLTGDLYELEIGPCARAPAKVKDGGLQRVREMVGDDTFMKLVSIKLEDLRAYLTPEQLEEVLASDVEYQSKRAIKVTKVEANPM